MVNRQEFMSVALKKCGNDPDTFSRLSRLWKSEEETLRSMTKTEVRDRLQCP